MDEINVGDWFERKIIRTGADYNLEEEIWTCQLISMKDRDDKPVIEFTESEYLLFLSTGKTLVRQSIQNFPVMVNPGWSKPGWYQYVIYTPIEPPADDQA